ncbi:hypothetical protein ACQF4J_32020 [Streptomyces sp. C1-1]|uniref:hypothetical protein n=1 Tax=Streptomyces sp. C1-1 TaxID=3231173 RepID=UPI003CFDEE97
MSDRSGAAHGVELRISTKGVDLAELLEGVTRRVCGTQPATTAFVAANGKIGSGG